MDFISITGILINIIIYIIFCIFFRYQVIPHPEKVAKGGEDALYTHDKWKNK